MADNTQESEKKHLSFKECFSAKAWKKHWKTWIPKYFLFSFFGFLLAAVFLLLTFFMVIWITPNLVIGVDYVPTPPGRGVYFSDLAEFAKSPPLQFFDDFFDTIFQPVQFLYVSSIGTVLITVLAGFLFLYMNLRNFHEKAKETKGYDNRVWIRDSRKMILTGDPMMVGKSLKTKFIWDNKKERPSGIVIGSVFVEDKDYNKIDKEQKMTAEVLESLRKQSMSENWKRLPSIEDWAKKYNKEKKHITDGVKKDLSRTDILQLKKSLKRDKYLAYDILNKKLNLKKKKLETLKQIELVKNANNKNLKVKKSK